MTVKLLFLNGVAIIFAVYHHAIYWAITAIFYWNDRFVSNINSQTLLTANPASLFLRITDEIAGVAVPIFLFVSGYFYAFSTNQKPFKQNIQTIYKRLIYLIPPYLLWSTITVLFRILEGNDYTAGKLVRVYLMGEADGPFYYVPLIIKLILLSPLLIRMLNKTPYIILGGSFLLQFLSSIFWYFSTMNLPVPEWLSYFAFLKNGYLASHLFWFVLGMLIFIKRDGLLKVIRRYRFILVSILLFFIILSQLEIQSLMNFSQKNWINSQASFITKLVYSLFILAVIGFIDNLKTSPNIQFIGTKSYGIYLSHILVIEICSRLIYHVIPFLLGQTLFFLGILVVVGIGIPLVMMSIWNRFPIKQFYSYVWG